MEGGEGETEKPMRHLFRTVTVQNFQFHGLLPYGTVHTFRGLSTYINTS